MWPFIYMGSPQNNSGAFIGFNNNRGWSSHAKSNFNIVNNGARFYMNFGNVNGVSNNNVADLANMDDDINAGGVGGV